jgi:hypothetical protein
MLLAICCLLLQGGDVRKKLEKKFNAAKEQFAVQPDGRVRATLTYDLLKKEQLEDFALINAELKDRLEVRGSADAPAALLFTPLITGDFVVKVEFSFIENPNQGKGLLLRTNTGDLTGAGDGMGIQLSRDKGWSVALQSWGGSGKVPVAKPVSISAGERVTLTLKRSGTKYTASFGTKVSVEATQAGMDPMRLRLGTWDPIQVSLVEVQAVLEPGWVKAALATAAVTKDLWNGQDLDGWETHRYPFKIEENAVAFDCRATMPAAMTWKQPLGAKSTEIEMTVVVEEVNDQPLAGFIMSFGGMTPQADGNLSLQWGDLLYLNKFADSKWGMIQHEKPSAQLAKGEHTFTLKVSGADVAFGVKGAGELKASGALSAKEFHLALFFQGVRGRITRVSSK